MKRVFNIGITGGIGSGKTRVCQYLEEKGVRIFNADLEARSILETNRDVEASIIQLFGQASYFREGEPNRAYIAAQAFQQASSLQALNAIVHPATLQAYEDWKLACAETYPFSYQCKEAAILYESGTDVGLDAIVCIYAPKMVRIQRIRQRDSLSISDISLRMSKQWSDAIKISRSDYIIFNDGLHDLPMQLEALMQTLSLRFGN